MMITQPRQILTLSALHEKSIYSNITDKRFLGILSSLSYWLFCFSDSAETADS